MAVLHNQKPILAVTMGDPAGIGPEIIVKALQLPKVWRVCQPLVIGSRTILERTYLTQAKLDPLLAIC